MKTISLLALLILAAPVLADNNLLVSAATRATPAPEPSNLLLDDPPFEPAPVQRGYSELQAEAIASGKPLVVWLGYPPVSPSPEYLHWHTSETEWHGYSGPAVIVSVPDGNRLLWVATIPAGECGPQAIRAAVIGARRVAVAIPQVIMRPMMAPMRMMAAPMGRGRSGGGC